MTADEVVAKSRQLLEQLHDLDLALAQRSDAIDAAARQEGRAATQAELNEIERINTDRGKVIDAMQELAFLTLVGIDQSTTVAKLKSDITTVNAGLKDTLKRLEAEEQFTAAAAAVLKGLADVAKGLVELA